jgi:hypothetical protein
MESLKDKSFIERSFTRMDPFTKDRCWEDLGMEKAT